MALQPCPLLQQKVTQTVVGALLATAIKASLLLMPLAVSVGMFGGVDEGGVGTVKPMDQVAYMSQFLV